MNLREKRTPTYLVREVLSGLKSHGYRPLHPPAEAVVLREFEGGVAPGDSTLVLLELRDDVTRELVRHEVRHVLLPAPAPGRKRNREIRHYLTGGGGERQSLRI